MEKEALEESLIAKLKVLSDTIWESRCTRAYLDPWLAQFQSDKEKLQALYILSQFMYFASHEMRELIRALYRDLFRYPIIRDIRKSNGDTMDGALVEKEFKRLLKITRFLGVGNPSESGYHLLYYFRQENKLPKGLFIHSHEIFTRSAQSATVAIRDPAIEHYVLIDDFCGSGHQAVLYSNELVELLKNLSPHSKVSYYVLFATEAGLNYVRKHSKYDDVGSVFTLDSTYKCFAPNSRHRPEDAYGLEWTVAEEMCRNYGKKILEDDPDLKDWPLGYDDGQLLIGFFHNVPDNTLPIIWSEGSKKFPWYPIFRRYPKIYGESP